MGGSASAAPQRARELKSERMTTPASIGHVPNFSECMACGIKATRDPMPHEACPAQERARKLVNEGYAALPSSPEEFALLIEEALPRRPM
jgi:hypothetical protein